jgi:hypothetical protein
MWPMRGKPRRTHYLQLSYQVVPAVAQKTQLRLVPVYRPWRYERPGWSEHVQVNILLKDVTNWPIWLSSDSNPGLPVSSPTPYNHETNSPTGPANVKVHPTDRGALHRSWIHLTMNTTFQLQNYEPGEQLIGYEIAATRLMKTSHF